MKVLAFYPALNPVVNDIVHVLVYLVHEGHQVQVITNRKNKSKSTMEGASYEIVEELPIHRILVALDVSTHSQAALKAAASVAALLEAELVGMFFEDINLLRVAQLPFVQEVCFPMAEVRDIGVSQMERHWRSQANEARRQLGEMATERRVKSESPDG